MAYKNNQNSKNQQPYKKRSGAKFIYKKDSGDVIGMWGWCLRGREKDLYNITVWLAKKNDCKKSGYHSAFAEVLNKTTGEVVGKMTSNGKGPFVSAVVNTHKNIAILQDMILVLNPTKNYCGTYLKN